MKKAISTPDVLGLCSLLLASLTWMSPQAMKKAISTPDVASSQYYSGMPSTRLVQIEM